MTGIVLLALATSLASPDGKLAVEVQDGRTPTYTLRSADRELIAPSRLGFAFAGEPEVAAWRTDANGVTRRDGVEAWKPVVKNRHAEVRLPYREITVPFLGDDGMDRMDVTFRAFDGGVAFRYTLVKWPSGDRRILDELTEFRVATNAFAWVGQNAHGSWKGSQESNFTKTPISKIAADSWCLPPFLVELDRTHFLALTSAALDHFPGFYLAAKDGALVTRLAPLPDEKTGDGVKAEIPATFTTPWRVVLVGDTPGRFIESEIVCALNPPCALENTGWIRPGMTAWDHWWSGEVRMEMPVIREYIDFAALEGWPYMLIDWQWYGRFNDPKADITKPAPQIDMPTLVAYAKERNVRLLLWIHSNDAARNDAYRRAFPIYELWGVAGVKIDFMDRYDQKIVDWYRDVVKAASRSHLLVNFHGAYCPDGIDRTYPNQITREGVLGEEYDKFDARVTPAHNVTLAFTRMLAGAMDYTPGGFLNVAARDWRRDSPTVVKNTRAQELAKFVVYESPLMCFCDHPTNVIGKVGADFVAEVPTEWDDTRFLGGYPDDYVAVARRKGVTWYVGVIGGDAARTVTIDFGFLPKGTQLETWRDGTTPSEAIRGFEELPAGNRLAVDLAPGGGFVARTTTPRTARQRLPGKIWNRGWQFRRGDAKDWTPCTLPHSLATPYFGASDFYEGDGWYLKSLTGEETDCDRLAIDFEGVSGHAEVWLDGVKVGSHAHGDTLFRIDLTPALKRGKAQEVLVKVSNRRPAAQAKPMDRHILPGGINRNVRLVASGWIAPCPDGVRLESSVLKREIGATVMLTNGCSTARESCLELQVSDPQGRLIARAVKNVMMEGNSSQSVTFSTRIASPQLWSPERPARYSVDVLLDGKSWQTVRTAFRTIHASKDWGFSLNGKRRIPLCANVSRDVAGWGNARTDESYRRDVRRTKEAGFDFIRGSHGPYPAAFLDACDEMGLILRDEGGVLDGSVKPPVAPMKGRAAKLELTTDRLFLAQSDGTDDALIKVTTLDALDHIVDDPREVTLTVLAGPAEFPTGRTITLSPTNGFVRGQGAISVRAPYAGVSVIEATAKDLAPVRLTLVSKAGDCHDADIFYREDVSPRMPDRL